MSKIDSTCTVSAEQLHWYYLRGYCGLDKCLTPHLRPGCVYAYAYGQRDNRMSAIPAYQHEMPKIVGKAFTTPEPTDD